MSASARARGEADGGLRNHLRRDLAEIIEGVDAGGVAVGPFEAEGVAADEFGLDDGEGLVMVTGENLEGDTSAAFAGLADGKAGRAGTEGTEHGEGVGRDEAVLPFDVELFGFIEVEAGWVGLKGHSGSVDLSG